jgi:hypothetical protein
MGVRVLFDPDAPYERRLPPWREAEVLRVDIEELTGSADRVRPADPAASLIEQTMMAYGTVGSLDGGDEPGR